MESDPTTWSLKIFQETKKKWENKEYSILRGITYGRVDS